MPIRPPRVSLVWKLALAYLALALIAAVTVRVVSLSLELHELSEDLGRGLLQRAAAEAAGQVGAELRPSARPDPVLMRRTLTAALRSVEESLSAAGHKGVVTEVGDTVQVALLAPDGELLGRVGAGASTRPVSVADSSHRWRYSAPVNSRSGARTGLLVVELQRHAPGVRALMGDGFEWPSLLIYAAVFGLGSAFVLQLSVTRRLKAIARTADAWSGGDFSHTVADDSADEIGQLSQRLDHMARQLEVLVAMRAEFAGVSERQRLARELHDTVKQKAFALQLQLAAAGRAPSLDPQVAQTLADARGITREIQEELAHLIGDTAAVSTQPFDQMLAERVETWGRRGRFAVSADLAAGQRVPAHHQPIVIRVLDEALANVMRHAGAAQAVVRLQDLGDRLELMVEDDGRGLRRVSEGMGLRNMRQRATELPDGSLAIDGERGGTRVTLSWAKTMTVTE